MGTVNSESRRKGGIRGREAKYKKMEGFTQDCDGCCFGIDSLDNIEIRETVKLKYNWREEQEVEKDEKEKTKKKAWKALLNTERETKH